MTGQTGKIRNRKKVKEAGPEVQTELIILDEQVEQQNHIFLLLTNRYNLLDILSSGLIKPASKYIKYYSDAGTICPEGIPLFVRPPSSDFIANVIGVEIGTFPVILEINLRDMHGLVQVVRDEYQ